jgi:hypothetical protein
MAMPSNERTLPPSVRKVFLEFFGEALAVGCFVVDDGYEFGF